MMMLLSRYKAIGIAAALLAAFFAGWAVNGWRLGGQISDQRAEWSETLRQTAEANAAVILKQQAKSQALADELASLDQSSTGKLIDAQQENERLRRLYGAADDERKRLRIEVIVARNDATVSATPGSGSVGDAASLELSSASGRTVWDIRAGMIEDRAKLEYLQGYVRSLAR